MRLRAIGTMYNATAYCHCGIPANLVEKKEMIVALIVAATVLARIDRLIDSLHDSFIQSPMVIRHEVRSIPVARFISLSISFRIDAGMGLCRNEFAHSLDKMICI